MKIHKYSNIIASKEQNRTILGEIETLSKCYPKIGKWFFKKVVPNIGNKRDIIFIEDEDNNILGFSIVKNKKKWLKISTFKIVDKEQNKGLGTLLLNYLLKEYSPKNGFYISFKHNNKDSFNSLFKRINHDKYRDITIKECYKTGDYTLYFSIEGIKDYI